MNHRTERRIIFLKILFEIALIPIRLKNTSNSFSHILPSFLLSQINVAFVILGVFIGFCNSLPGDSYWWLFISPRMHDHEWQCALRGYYCWATCCERFSDSLDKAVHRLPSYVMPRFNGTSYTYIGRSLSFEIYLRIRVGCEQPHRKETNAPLVLGFLWPIDASFAYLMKIDKITHRGAYCFCTHVPFKPKILCNIFSLALINWLMTCCCH